MRIEDYFSSDPNRWQEVLRLSSALKESGLDSALPEAYPGGWFEPQLSQSIWDPELFGKPGGPAMGWGKIDVGGVVHPATFGLIGDHLGISALQVRNIAWWQLTLQDGELVPLSNIDHRLSGGRLLRHMLSKVNPISALKDLGMQPADLIFPLVAVPPLLTRPPVAVVGGVSRPAQLDVLLNDLAWKATGSDLNFEGDQYSWLMERSTSLGVQVALERAVHCVEKAWGCDRWETEQLWVNQLPVAEEGAWQPEEQGQGQDFPEVITPEMVPEAWEAEDLADLHAVRNIPLRMLEKQENQIWMQFTDRLIGLDWERGKRTSQTATMGELLGQTKAGKLAYRLHGQLCLLDPEQEAWVLDHSGDGFVYPENTETEKATLVNFSTYQSLALLEVLESPICEVRDASGQYLWVEDKEQHGGVYELETGHLLFSPGTFQFREEPLFLDREGQLIALSQGAMEIMEETLAEAAGVYLPLDVAGKMEQAAFCLRNNRWWFFAFNSLWIQGSEVWRVDKAVTAAAFSLDGKRLFLANDSELRTLTLDDQGKPTQTTIYPLSMFIEP